MSHLDITKALLLYQWGSDIMITEEAAVETVKEAVTAASVLNHVRNNRVEYILAMFALHLLGASDRLLAQLSGVCF